MKEILFFLPSMIQNSIFIVQMMSLLIIDLKYMVSWRWQEMNEKKNSFAHCNDCTFYIQYRVSLECHYLSINKIKWRNRTKVYNMWCKWVSNAFGEIWIFKKFNAFSDGLRYFCNFMANWNHNKFWRLIFKIKFSIWVKKQVSALITFFHETMCRNLKMTKFF